MPRRRVALILSALVFPAVMPVAGNAAPAAPTIARAPVETPINANDNRFEPTVPQVSRGGTAVFYFPGGNTHAAADDLLGLYDSGNVAPGGPSFSYTFVAAGIYPFTCVVHLDQQMTGRIHVPMQAKPSKGPLKRAYTLTWASAEAAPGFAYDVRLKRPGHTWSAWRSSVGVRNGTYQPHAGKGVYRFKARLRRTDTGDVSLWSDAVSITVG